MSVSRIWLAGVLLFLGGLFALEAADVLDAGDTVGDIWPATVIAAGALQLVFGRPRHWLGPVFLMAAGGLGLALTTGALSSIGPLLWSTIFIALALAVIMRSFTSSGPALAVDEVNSFVLFGGREMASHSKRFQGGSVSCVFGGTELDLRDAELAPDAALEVFTAFGGTEISVPYGWRVEMQGMPLFGGFENATAKDVDLPIDAPVLAIDGIALFGAIEVKH